MNNKRNDALSNIKRVLKQMEKALDRLSRQNYHRRCNRAPLFDQIENAIERMRSQIDNYRMFSGVNGFFTYLSLCIKEISELIGLLSKTVRPTNGKKQVKESIKRKNRRSLLKSVDSMLENVAKLINESKPIGNDMSIWLEKALAEAFVSHCEQGIEKEENTKKNRRGEKTYIFPWQDPDNYADLVCDRKRFKAWL